MGGRILSAAVAVILTAMAPAAMAADTSSPTLSAGPAPRPAPATSGVPASMPNDRILGRADAPVTIIEYASYTCSHCAVFNTTVLPSVKERFIDTGKVRLIYRDLPTAPLQVSASLAALARCSAPDRFFDVTEYLFGGQDAAFRSQDLTSWMRGAIPHSGRTEEELLTCMQDPQTRDALNTDIEAARAAGVNSTPTVYVNGRHISPATLDSVVEAITPLVR